MGTHLLVEVYGCRADLNDLPFIRDTMIHAALECGATILDSNGFYPFVPQGLTGFLPLAESHMSIHTWPELDSSAAIDVYTCGTLDPMLAVKYIIKELKPREYYVEEKQRGRSMALTPN